MGVGCPGILLPDGVMYSAANFPTWDHAPLLQLFKDQLEGLEVG